MHQMPGVHLNIILREGNSFGQAAKIKEQARTEMPWRSAGCFILNLFVK